jgi:hypothetical protein
MYFNISVCFPLWLYFCCILMLLYIQYYQTTDMLLYSSTKHDDYGIFEIKVLKGSFG